MKAPDTSTHFVSLEVVTVNVNTPVFLAYTVPPTVTVPVPPVNAADVTEDANAGAATNTMPVVTSAEAAASSILARVRPRVRVADSGRRM
ncbi:MAG: hypothetical protein AUG44_19620 [Actinobacteria bacterium 13_1_20CM_3_71_11]|nr:MAG: hypothetical protein AUG44_19620 [Actinobacteria bacterium 13_1_20CM_3_71_11]